MITAIDTNILIDIFGADPRHGKASSEMLARCMQKGAVCICKAMDGAKRNPGRAVILSSDNHAPTINTSQVLHTS